MLDERAHREQIAMSGLGSPLRLVSRSLFLVSLLTISSGLVAQTALSVQSINFGSVQAGSSLILPMAVSDGGNLKITIQHVRISGSGFSFVGPNLPMILTPAQKSQLSLSFSPQGTGSASGTATVVYWVAATKTSRGYSGRAVASLSGNETGAAAHLGAPSSLNLGSVPVGGSQSKALTVSNTGGSSLTISAASVTGSGFTVSGLPLPYSLAAGTSANLSVTFAPNSSGTDSASLVISSNASDPSVTVSLNGTATTPTGALSVTPGSMSFGNVTVGSSQSKSGSVTASGGSVTLSSASSNNSEFTISGLTFPVTLAAGQSASFSLTFAPTAAGSASANISFSASNSASASEAASGSGATIQHTVALSWSASTSSSIAGYNVYRASSATGAYSRINSALSPSMSYSDSTVQSGQTYYYATTAVDTAGAESTYSNRIQIAVPLP